MNTIKPKNRRDRTLLAMTHALLVAFPKWMLLLLLLWCCARQVPVQTMAARTYLTAAEIAERKKPAYAALSLIIPGTQASGTWAAETESQVGSTYTVTFDASTDLMSGVSTGALRDGMWVYFSNSGGALPTGLTAGNKYFVKDLGDGTWRIYADYADFLVDTNRIDLATAGTGTHTLTPALLNDAPYFRWITPFDDSIIKNAAMALWADGEPFQVNERLVMALVGHGNGLDIVEAAADAGSKVQMLPIACMTPHDAAKLGLITELADTSLPYMVSVYAARIRTSDYETSAGLSNTTKQSEIRGYATPKHAGKQYIAQGLPTGTTDGEKYSVNSLRIFVDVRNSPTYYCAVVDPNGGITTGATTTGVFNLSSTADSAGLTTAQMYSTIEFAITAIRTKATASDTNLNNAVIFVRGGIHAIPTFSNYRNTQYAYITPSAQAAAGSVRLTGGFSIDGARCNLRRLEIRGGADRMKLHFPYPKKTRYVLTSVDAAADTVTVAEDINTISDGEIVSVYNFGTGVMPGGLDWTTHYYVRKISAPLGGPGVMALYPTRGDALSDTNRINITSAGSGTIRLETTSATQTVYQFTADATTNYCTQTNVPPDTALPADFTTACQFYVTGSDTLPSPLVAGTTYWLRATTGPKWKVYPTQRDSFAATNEIDITTTGSGTLYMWCFAQADSSGFWPNQEQNTQIFRFTNIDFINSADRSSNMIVHLNSKADYVGCTINRNKHGLWGRTVQGSTFGDISEDAFRAQQTNGQTCCMIDNVVTNQGLSLNYHPDMWHGIDNTMGNSSFNSKYVACDTQFLGACPGGILANCFYGQNNPSPFLYNANNYPQSATKISSVDTTANTITFATATLAVGYVAPMEFYGTPPAPLQTGVIYWVLPSSTTVGKVYATRLAALAGGTDNIDLTDAGTNPTAGTPNRNTITLHITGDVTVPDLWRDGSQQTSRSSVKIGCAYYYDTYSDNPRSGASYDSATTTASVLRQRIWGHCNIAKQTAVVNDFVYGQRWVENYDPSTYLTRDVSLVGIRTCPVDGQNNPRYKSRSYTAVGWLANPAEYTAAAAAVTSCMMPHSSPYGGWLGAVAGPVLEF